MTAVTSDDFLAAVRTSGLLPPDRCADLDGWALANRVTDSHGIAKELHRRDWLTAYQIREIYKGRGGELTVGPYVLLDLLGEGGMGRVFKAHFTRLGRDVAIKLIRKEKLANPNTVRRFRQEVRAAAQLSHPNVVLAFDADEVDGHHYFAMEYVDGSDLTRVVRDRGPLPVPVACEYVRQAALGLQHAFEQGLVHRDVKPSNLILTKGGVVKVLDLGLALLNEPDAIAEELTRVTVEGFVLGTPDFLAPEQARNPLAVDTRADVYALGGTLYFLLTGKVPYDAPTASEKLLQHVMAPPPSVARHRPDIAPDVEALVHHLMAKAPADRPQTPLQTALALQPFCQPPASGTLPPPSARLTPQMVVVPELSLDAAGDAVVRPVVRPRRSGRLGWLAAVVAVAVVGLIGYAGFTQLTPTPDPAAAPPAEYTNPLGMKLLLLPGGRVTTGTSPDDAAHRKGDPPPAEVEVPGPFYLATTETTNAQYTQLIGRTPSAAAARARYAAESPVESVTWDEAVAFCGRLNEKDAKRPKGWAYRLPTEAEWEYACRAGSAAAFACGARVVPGKDAVVRPDADDPFAEATTAKAPSVPWPVGKTAANRLGLFDLHGNVGEWCGGGDPLARPARGGGWDQPAAMARSAARRLLPTGTRDPAVGFRVVLGPP